MRKRILTEQTTTGKSNENPESLGISKKSKKENNEDKKLLGILKQTLELQDNESSQELLKSLQQDFKNNPEIMNQKIQEIDKQLEQVDKEIHELKQNFQATANLIEKQETSCSLNESENSSIFNNDYKYTNLLSSYIDKYLASNEIPQTNEKQEKDENIVYEEESYIF